MSTPRRRPIPIDPTWNHDLEQFRKAVNRDIDSILAGVSSLKADARDGGWPGRGTHDRKARRHIAKVCDCCHEKFTTDDAARTHRDDTGHDRFTDPNKSTTATVWQCCTCANQFPTWEAFQDHAEDWQDDDTPDDGPHQEAEEVTAGHGNAGRAHQDPAGEAAMQLWDRLGDLDTMQDHLRAVLTSWRALMLVSRRHQPDGDKRTEPACWHESCENVVEKRVLSDGSISYRGMVCIGGVWYARPDEQPKCAKHRKSDERAA